MIVVVHISGREHIQRVNGLITISDKRAHSPPYHLHHSYVCLQYFAIWALNARNSWYIEQQTCGKSDNN